MVSADFPLPGIVHGKRILATVIETRAKAGTNTEPWISLPINDDDLSEGYRDVSFQELNNAANHAAHWLSHALPTPSEPFQCFAYAGPKDLRYAVLAVAAAKLQKVMILPSPLVTPEAQLRILALKNCKLYLRPVEMARPVDAILQKAPDVKSITVPGAEEFLKDEEPSPVVYGKTWEEGKDDPWLVFHTSGTTGNPKPITYTHQMMAGADVAASLPDIEESYHHQYAQRRWYTPLPSLHLVGMLLSLSITSFLHMTSVIGPPAPVGPKLLIDIFRHGRIDGAVLLPALIDQLCLLPEGLQALRELQYVHYAGAPLSSRSGDLLSPYTQVVPCVGSTESGGYFTIIHNRKDAWEYISFQAHAGATFEPRTNNLHELVFIRDPNCAMQQIFHAHPTRDTFPTNDLWVQHPFHKNLWKIIGRSDDYVYLAHGEGLHASLLEPEITAHPRIQCAIIGGHGHIAPVLLIEPVPDVELDSKALKTSLIPYIDRVNAKCHPSVQLSPERVILATSHKPFPRTLKGSIARTQTLSLYQGEIASLFA
ncbi:putative AMP-binding enzyme [Aspergillus avenaceus]|uniref:Putative AMP-binding enzyme n=1 Tax=Aspergillus avenaceus TaxID=36643 RepID=A0A5N6U0R9_ASPAV|nr:putative AMP-binding enzyme [Aspergillus avenaceus]